MQTPMRGFRRSKACRDAFKVGSFKKGAARSERGRGDQWGTAYDVTIDMGAHSNSGAFWTNLEETDSTDTLLQYVHTEATSLKQAMSKASFAGVHPALITTLGEMGGMAHPSFGCTTVLPP